MDIGFFVSGYSSCSPTTISDPLWYIFTYIIQCCLVQVLPFIRLLFFRWSQACSVRFVSDEVAGHSSPSVWTMLSRCGRALSSSNKIPGIFPDKMIRYYCGYIQEYECMKSYMTRPKSLEIFSYIDICRQIYSEKSFIQKL